MNLPAFFWLRVDSAGRVLPFLRAIFLATFLLCLAYCPLANGKQETQVQRLLRDLQAQDYSQRQTALEELWNLGPGILSELEQANEQLENPEACRRLRILIEAFKLNLSPETPAALARNVLLFNRFEYAVQREVLANLQRLDRVDLIVKLIEGMPETRRGTAFTKYVRLNSLIPRWVRLGDFASADQLLSHPLTQEYKLNEYLFWNELNGRTRETAAEQIQRFNALSKQVSELQAKLDLNKELEGVESEDQPDPQTKPTGAALAAELKKQKQKHQHELRRLLQVLRTTGQHEEAFRFAKEIEDEKQRANFRNHILMEMGDWKAVAKNLVDPDRKPNYQADEINAPFARQIVASYFAGDRENVDRCLEKLKWEYGNLKRSKKVDKSKLLAQENKIARCYLLLGDWENARPWLEKNLLRTRVHQLVALQKHRELLEWVRYRDDAESRLSWSAKLVKRLEALAKQFKRTENDRFSSRRSELFYYSVFFLDQLHDLGFQDEAAYHRRILAQHYGDDNFFSISRLETLIQHLVKRRRFDDADEIVRAYFRPDQLYGLANVLFQDRREVATQFWATIAQSNQSLEDKIQLARQLLQVTLKSPPLDSAIVDQLQANLSTASSESYRVQYATYLACYRGDFDLLARLLYDSAYSTKKHRHFGLHLASLQEAFHEVINLADQPDGRDAFPDALVAEAYNRVGNFEMAKLIHLGVYIGSASRYNNSARIVEFQNHQRLSLIERTLNILVHSTGTSDSWMSEGLRQSLGRALATTNPVRSRDYHRLHMYISFHDTNAADIKFLEKLKWLGQIETAALCSQGHWEKANARRKQHLNLFGPDTELIRQVMLSAKQELHQEIINSWVDDESELYFNWLQEFPSSPLIHNNYAWLLACTNRRLEFAKQHAEFAVSAEENPSYLDTLALVEWKLNNRARARELQKACIQLNPVQIPYWQRYFQYGGSLIKRSKSKPSE